MNRLTATFRRVSPGDGVGKRAKPRFRLGKRGFREGLGGDLLSHHEGSTIGAAGLNDSVRDGKRCTPRAIATKNMDRPPLRAAVGYR